MSRTSLQVPFHGQDAARVAHNGFHDDGGDLIPLLMNSLFKERQIVPWQDDHILKGSTRLTLTRGNGLRGVAGAGGIKWRLNADQTLSNQPW